MLVKNQTKLKCLVWKLQFLSKSSHPFFYQMTKAARATRKLFSNSNQSHLSSLKITNLRQRVGNRERGCKPWSVAEERRESMKESTSSTGVRRENQIARTVRFTNTLQCLWPEPVQDARVIWVERCYVERNNASWRFLFFCPPLAVRVADQSQENRKRKQK